VRAVIGICRHLVVARESPTQGSTVHSACHGHGAVCIAPLVYFILAMDLAAVQHFVTRPS
jgi:hypothetical protein